MHGILFEPPLSSNFIAHQLDEIYREKIYTPFLHGRKGLTIVDIGGNIGTTSYYFSEYADRVITLEPASDHIKVIKEMLKYNDITNVTPRQEALYTKSGEYELNKHSANKTMYSLYSTVSDRKLPPEKVKTISIDKLFEEEKIEKCHFMKLDCEGSEGEIVCHSSFAKVAPKIQAMVIELHSWADRNPAQITQALKQLGFHVEKLEAHADIISASR